MSATLIAGGVALGTLAASLYNNYKNQQFQKAENDTTREREDNAIQRQVADLQAAGLSPTLATGNGASAQGLTAPSSDLSGVNDALANYLSIQGAKYQNDVLKSQKDNLDANNDLAQADLDIKQEELRQMKKFGYRNFDLASYGIYNADQAVFGEGKNAGLSFRDRLLDHNGDVKSMRDAFRLPSQRNNPTFEESPSVILTESEGNDLEKFLSAHGYKGASLRMALDQAGHWKSEKWSMTEIKKALVDGAKSRPWEKELSKLEKYSGRAGKGSSGGSGSSW